MYLHLYLKLSLEIFFTWGFDHFLSKSGRQFQTHFWGSGRAKLSLSETELFEKKKGGASLTSKIFFSTFMCGLLFFLPMNENMEGDSRFQPLVALLC